MGGRVVRGGRERGKGIVLLLVVVVVIVGECWDDGSNSGNGW